MRQPQQQNRRGRGRGRKPQNPLQRGYESNGPDVKIRGNASHIAEKYITLARDALSSGDTVMAENYLQHAEHYNRIIASAQQQQESNGQNSHHNNSANGQANGRGDGGHRNNRRNQNASSEEQPAEQTSEVIENAEKSVPEEVAAEEPAPKPRRRRAPRAKAATPTEDGDAAAKPGPVRMGDMPADETAG